jgi:elongation factor P--(R)-beta-lysine ligase
MNKMQFKYLDDYLQLIQGIKSFFHKQDFRDIIVPPLVENPGIEPHIHPFQAYSAFKRETLPLYLHTSPEFFLKRILSLGFDKIFSLQHSFRDEPATPTHRAQFLMLEWYRKNSSYSIIMDDVASLFHFLIKDFLPSCMVADKWKVQPLVWQKKTVREIILETDSFDIDHFHEKKEFYDYLAAHFPKFELHRSSYDEWVWEDLFFLYFLNRIEPLLEKIPLLILYEFPAPLAALSKIHPNNPKSALRFEIYIEGLEIANCFEELINKSEFEKRLHFQQSLKKKIYDYQLPEPKKFLETMSAYPESSGIALGVERLYQKITDRPGVFYPGIFADDLTPPEA